MFPSWKRGTRFGLVLVLLALAAIPTGCGGRTVYVTRAQLEVQNEWFSSEAIVGVDLNEVFGPNMLTYDVTVFPSDSAVFDVPPGDYDLTVYWGDGGLETYLDVEVFTGRTTVVRASR